MATRETRTLEAFVESGGDITSCIREETLLLHGSWPLAKNTIEARIIAKIVLPEGTEFEAEKVIKVRFSRLPAPSTKERA